MPFETTFKIRTFHTDGFGHVNNARYLELLEEARWQFAEYIELVGLLRESNLGFIIMDLRIRFRAPVVEGDSIDIGTSLVTLGTASGEVKQVVRRNGEPGIATNCISHFILIDRVEGKSVPIDGPIRDLLLKIIESEKVIANELRTSKGKQIMSEQPIDLTQFVEGAEGISVIRTKEAMGGENFRGWNGIKYKAGLSAKNVNAKKLSMNVATVAPGAVAYAHIHDGFELMLYIMQGNVRHIFGENLAHTVDNEAGDFIYIEPGVPHEVYNLSETEPVVAVVARSDADEWQKIIPYPSEARDRDGVHK